jgi:hypothetical protein
MPTVVTDPDLIRRVREAAGQRPQASPAQTASPTGGRVVTDPGVIQGVKNRARLQDKAKQRALEIGHDMPEAPDRIAQGFDVAARGPEGAGYIPSALEGAGDASSFGFGDEIGAALDLPVSSLWSRPKDHNAPSAYDINLARRRQSLEHAQVQNPWTTAGGQVVGAVGGGLLAPGLGGVGAAARGASRRACVPENCTEYRGQGAQCRH